LRIVIISYKFYPDVGGIETISEGLAGTFVSAGHEVQVLTTTRESGSKTFSFLIHRNPSLFKTLSTLRWAHVVLENNPSLRLSWPNIFLNKPIVVGLQTWFGLNNTPHTLTAKAKRWWLKRASYVVACSTALKEVLYNDAIVIANPYNESLFRKTDNVTRSKDFVFLGRLVSDKGADKAIEAFKKVLGHVSGSTLTLIGDGEEAARLKQMVGEYRLENKVVFTGNMRGEQLVQVLNEHQFILVPSLWAEPFGLVVLEGMACGCIPIASNTGGLPEAVGNAGLLFENRNVEDLATKMLTLQKDKKLQEQLISEAPAHLKTHRLTHVSQQYLHLLESAI
jgi:glycosyltransferase involved in cell wall biosynthesis